MPRKVISLNDSSIGDEILDVSSLLFSGNKYLAHGVLGAARLMIGDEVGVRIQSCDCCICKHE